MSAHDNFFVPATKFRYGQFITINSHQAQKCLLVSLSKHNFGLLEAALLSFITPNP